MNKVLKLLGIGLFGVNTDIQPYSVGSEKLLLRFSLTCGFVTGKFSGRTSMCSVCLER